MDNNSIIISNEDFSIPHVLDCGQVFRYTHNSTHYTLKTLGKTCILYNKNNDVIIENEDKAYFTNYFDLNTDYGEIKRQLRELPFMKPAIEHGYGIRILNQDPFETVISFIISANNNIPRIKKIIDAICNMGAFPTQKELASFDTDFFTKCGAGYRANYLYKTAQKLNNGEVDLNIINSFNTVEATTYLCKNVMGVGPKVADCIMLFGYHRMDVFPVDTWIEQVYKEHFENASVKQMRKKLIDIYGNLSGFAQQYLFYNKRENS